jgi:hypothetical protein
LPLDALDADVLFFILAVTNVRCPLLIGRL